MSTKRNISSNSLQESYPLVIGADEKILRTVIPEEKEITKELLQFGRDLIELMIEYNGVGLAAPQVGQFKRVFAYCTLKNDDGSGGVVKDSFMINPRVISQSDLLVTDEEGCLSLPKLTGDVRRPDRITIEYINPKGKKVIEKVKDYNARIILHELDHLDGVLIVDKFV